MATDQPGLFEELKRRHVWRVAAGYAVASWLLVQVATQVFPFFNVPNWVVRLVVLLLALGFPVAVVLAWIFEITPDGIRRTTPADSPDARPVDVHREVGRKLNNFIIVALLCTVALLGWRLLEVRTIRSPDSAQRNPGHAAPSTKPANSAAATTASTPRVPQSIPAKSVAVLPFTNESGKADEQYFSDGLSDDLITALAQINGLKVISRNSAFQFRDSKASSAAIGIQLGVAHLLEGSVQRAGSEVRITATLVNAADGSTLWSKQYSRPYTDLFALQDAITDAVAAALKTKLLTAPGAVLQSDHPPSGNLDAYAAYQKGVDFDRLDTADGYHRAIAAYAEAIRLDPRYAAAFAQMSGDWVLLGVHFDDTGGARDIANARAAAAKAVELDPNLALAHRAQAFLMLSVDMDWKGAEAAARRTLQLAPSDVGAQSLLAGVLATLGQNQQALGLQRQVLTNDPRREGANYNLALYLTSLGKLDEATTAIDKAIALQPGATTFYQLRSLIDILRGNAAAALADANREPAGPWRDVAVMNALQVGHDRAAADAALQKFIAANGKVAAYQIAETYALRGDPNAMFHWLDEAEATHDSGISNVLGDPLILRYRNDPRFTAFCRKVGLPTTTDAVAMQ